jgi:hypothetical protein
MASACGYAYIRHHTTSPLVLVTVYKTCRSSIITLHEPHLHGQCTEFKLKQTGNKCWRSIPPCELCVSVQERNVRRERHHRANISSEKLIAAAAYVSGVATISYMVYVNVNRASRPHTCPHWTGRQSRSYTVPLLTHPSKQCTPQSLVEGLHMVWSVGHHLDWPRSRCYSSASR